MKKILPLFLSLLLAALCLWATPLAASADNDSDGNPDYKPPYPSGAVATTSVSLNQLEVLFLDDADNAVVEVYDENDTLVYRINGKVDSYDTLRVDARRWQGCYTVRVTLKGRSQTFKLSL